VPIEAITKKINEFRKDILGVDLTDLLDEEGREELRQYVLSASQDIESCLKEIEWVFEPEVKKIRSAEDAIHHKQANDIYRVQSKIGNFNAVSGALNKTDVHDLDSLKIIIDAIRSIRQEVQNSMGRIRALREKNSALSEKIQAYEAQRKEKEENGGQEAVHRKKKKRHNAQEIKPHEARGWTQKRQENEKKIEVLRNKQVDAEDRLDSVIIILQSALKHLVQTQGDGSILDRIRIRDLLSQYHTIKDKTTLSRQISNVLRQKSKVETIVVPNEEIIDTLKKTGVITHTRAGITKMMKKAEKSAETRRQKQLDFFEKTLAFIGAGKNENTMCPDINNFSIKNGGWTNMTKFVEKCGKKPKNTREKFELMMRYAKEREKKGEEADTKYEFKQRHHGPTGEVAVITMQREDKEPIVIEFAFNGKPSLFVQNTDQTYFFDKKGNVAYRSKSGSEWNAEENTPVELARKILSRIYYEEVIKQKGELPENGDENVNQDDNDEIACSLLAVAEDQTEDEDAKKKKLSAMLKSIR
jgi:hypothetical protein